MSGAQPLRCLYLGHAAQLSGGEIALARLIEGLADEVHAEVWLAEDGDLRAALEDLGVRVRIVPLGKDVVNTSRAPSGLSDLWRVATGAMKMLRYALRLAHLIRSDKFDVIHCNTLKSGLYGCIAGRLAGTPVVWHIRDRLAGDYMPAKVASVMRWAVALLPHHVIANSEATRRTLGSIRPTKVTALPDMLPRELLGRGVTEVDDSPSPFRFALVGRISPWKGQLIALQAFERLEAPLHAAHLHFIGAPMFGESAYAEELTAKVEASAKRSSVHLHGFVRDVPELLAGMHALLHTSTIPEPFGQVVLEGLALGVPVIASAAGGVVEILEDGACGLLTPVGDVGALAQAMATLLADTALRRRLHDAGERRAQDFVPSVIAPRYVELYRSLVKDSGVTDRH